MPMAGSRSIHRETNVRIRTRIRLQFAMLTAACIINSGVITFAALEVTEHARRVRHLEVAVVQVFKDLQEHKATEAKRRPSTEHIEARARALAPAPRCAYVTSPLISLMEPQNYDL